MSFTPCRRFSSIHELSGPGGFTAMYINRALLLAMAILLVFLPSIERWIFDSGAAWYRIYALWLLIVVGAYWNQRASRSDEL